MSLEEFLDVFEYNDKCYINVYKKDVEDKEYHKKVIKKIEKELLKLKEILFRYQTKKRKN